MNDKLRRIDPLIRRVEERQNAVAKEYANKIRALSAQEQRLNDLLRFCDEYSQWPIGDSISPAQIGNRQAFRGRLGEAVESQKKQVDNSRSQAELERVRLTVVSRERKVVDKLADNYREEQRRVEDRLSQRQLDDYAVARHGRRAEEDAE
ncbi:flagellar export protein FliJ [Pseudomarimonas arenosa]|uniref:Flagellar FliJ protein n=1 Tax=Pseudomarimonas arenosa TaxID=2774145 RepID=A0AAW3ZJ63_9GAMM|nr:flagellar export protein FliJ [Pseudomarimonas arenosa]MBD8524737.1 flagellar export protein FliJ [Pseudomarimonas arenosa]